MSISLDGISLGTNANLQAIGALTPTDGLFIVGNGTTFVGESGATARTSIGLGTSDTVTFSEIVNTPVQPV